MSRILNPDEVKRFLSLQEYFSVDQTAKRLEDFGKWIFTAVTTVATLATGFSLSKAAEFTFAAKVDYAIAMVFVGLSLASAVAILTPGFTVLKLGSPQSLNAEFSASIRSRRGWILASAIFLSTAFVVAAIAPATAALFQPAPAHQETLTYSVTEKSFSVKLHVEGLAPGSAAKLEIDRRTPATSEKPFADALSFRVEGTADEKGIFHPTADALPLTTFEPIVISYKAVSSNGKPISPPPTVVTLAKPQESQKQNSNEPPAGSRSPTAAAPPPP